MFHVAEIDYTTTAGAKEGGVVQPALAVSESAPNEKPVIEEMYERRISNVSRREIFSIRMIEALESSVRKEKSSRRSLVGSPSPKQDIQIFGLKLEWVGWDRWRTRVTMQFVSSSFSR